jgi:hypothetical protein
MRRFQRAVGAGRGGTDLAKAKDIESPRRKRAPQGCIELSDLGPGRVEDFRTRIVLSIPQGWDSVPEAISKQHGAVSAESPGGSPKVR